MTSHNRPRGSRKLPRSGRPQRSHNPPLCGHPHSRCDPLLSDRPHRRYNPLLDEWVLCSPHRLERPWRGQVEDAEPERLRRHDPDCYLCPGNIRAPGTHNPMYRSTFVFDNDYPSLLPSPTGNDITGSQAMSGSGPAPLSSSTGDSASAPTGAAQPTPPADAAEGNLLQARPVSGICRVICFSPRHDLTLARMEPAAIRQVVDAWAEQEEQLGSRNDVAYVELFENKGAMMGCSNPHPHGQIWGLGELPTYPVRKHAAQRSYSRAHGSDLLGDYLAQEIRLAERVVLATEHWVWLVPFWAVWPFETMLIPRRLVPDLQSLRGDERDALADIIQRLNACYDSLFSCSFPYSMGWHGRPTDGSEHPYWRLHAVYFPPLLRSATIRKFMVGFEMLGEPQRDLTPELAASRLREALP